MEEEERCVVIFDDGRFLNSVDRGQFLLRVVCVLSQRAGWLGLACDEG